MANVPTSWWNCKKLLNTQPTGRLNAKKRSICPSCSQMSGKIDCCTECDTNYNTVVQKSSIPIFYHFDIGLQLETILRHTSDVVFQDRSLPPQGNMRDIVDGLFYRKYLKEEDDLFVTLTMNIDGVQPNKGTDNSIWPVLMIVNEIQRKKRYSLDNVILAGVWPGPKKPTRDEMAIFLHSM